MFSKGHVQKWWQHYHFYQPELEASYKGISSVLYFDPSGYCTMFIL